MNPTLRGIKFSPLMTSLGSSGVHLGRLAAWPQLGYFPGNSDFKAEIYSYSRSRGLFAGVALDGSALRIDYDANESIYGKGITPRRIFEGGVGNVPTQVVDFRDRLEEYTQR